jgi:hypothetical protein
VGPPLSRLCSTIRAGGDGSSTQWWTDRQKAVPIDRAARRFAGAKAEIHGHGGGAPLCGLARRDADAGRRCDRTRQGCPLVQPSCPSSAVGNGGEPRCLRGEAYPPNILQKPLKIGPRGTAHGSICIQEGHVHSNNGPRDTQKQPDDDKPQHIALDRPVTLGPIDASRKAHPPLTLAKLSRAGC